MSYKSETLKSYEKHAAFFSNYFKRMFDEHKRKEFGKFLEYLEGKKILDLGCAGGDHTLYFKNQGLEAIGIDFSPAMIELARQKGVNAYLMNMEKLGFQRELFDGVWAVNSLLHLPKNKLPGVLEGITHTLKQGGIFYVCMKEGDGEGLVPDKSDPSTKRFFAYWKKQELIDVFSTGYRLLEFYPDKLGETNYLKMFFRKN